MRATRFTCLLGYLIVPKETDASGDEQLTVCAEASMPPSATSRRPLMLPGPTTAGVPTLGALTIASASLRPKAPRRRSGKGQPGPIAQALTGVPGIASSRRRPLCARKQQHAQHRGTMLVCQNLGQQPLVLGIPHV